MLIFPIVDMAVSAAISVCFFIRFRQYVERRYLYLCFATAAAAVSSALLAFLGDGFETLNAVFIYLSLIVYMMVTLVYIMMEVGMLLVWITSMRNAPRPRAYKLLWVGKLMRVLRWAYPVFTFLLVVFFVLLIVTLTWATVLTVVVGLMYTIVLFVQTLLILWLYLDVRVVGNASELQKRNQLLRILALSLLSSFPPLLSGVGAGIGSSICWWLWFGVALWPKALVGFDMPPETATPGMMEGGSPVFK